MINKIHDIVLNELKVKPKSRKGAKQRGKPGESAPKGSKT